MRTHSIKPTSHSAAKSSKLEPQSTKNGYMLCPQLMGEMMYISLFLSTLSQVSPLVKLLGALHRVPLKEARPLNVKEANKYWLNAVLCDGLPFPEIRGSRENTNGI